MPVEVVIRKDKSIDVYGNEDKFHYSCAHDRVLENATFLRVGERGLRIAGDEVVEKFFYEEYGAEQPPPEVIMSDYESNDIKTKKRLVFQRRWPFVRISTVPYLRGWCTKKQRKSSVIEVHGNYSINYTSPHLIDWAFGSNVKIEPIIQATINSDVPDSNSLSGIEI